MATGARTHRSEQDNVATNLPWNRWLQIAIGGVVLLAFLLMFAPPLIGMRPQLRRVDEPLTAAEGDRDDVARAAAAAQPDVVLERIDELVPAGLEV